MDIRAQVSNWVEKKIGSIIDEDLKVKIVHEYSQFNIQTYVKSLEDKFFTQEEMENFRNTLNNDFQSIVNDFDSCNSDEENDSKDSLEFASQEFQAFSLDEIVKNLESDSDDIKVQSLQALEAYAEEIINHTSWIIVEKTLMKTLKDRTDRKIHNMVLKVFFKFLTCTNKPQIVCKVFTSISRVLGSLIKDDNLAYEELYDIKGDSWLHKNKTSSDDPFRKSQNSVNFEVPIKLMWLLINFQQQMPEKWVRFNEKRFREIIFPFVHLLSSTNLVENKNLTALELLSILNPTASWCHCCCHTAVGRIVLCAALRKYKKFFIQMIEIILNKIKSRRKKQSLSVRSSNEITTTNYSKKENNYSNCFPKKKGAENENYLKKERTKHIRSAPVDLAENDRHLIFWRTKKNSKWLTEIIPKGVVTEAVFWHSVSVVVCLLQFRSGQALFPIQTGTRKRSLSAQDLSLSLIEYLENMEYNESENEGFAFSTAYQAEVLKKTEILRDIRNNILLSRIKMEESPRSHI